MKITRKQLRQMIMEEVGQEGQQSSPLPTKAEIKSALDTATQALDSVFTKSFSGDDLREPNHPLDDESMDLYQKYLKKHQLIPDAYAHDKMAMLYFLLHRPEIK